MTFLYQLLPSQDVKNQRPAYLYYTNLYNATLINPSHFWACELVLVLGPITHPAPRYYYSSQVCVRAAEEVKEEKRRERQRERERQEQ